MTHLYLIRHAEQDGKKRDLGLSLDGITQAERLRDRLARSREIQPDVLSSAPSVALKRPRGS